MLFLPLLSPARDKDFSAVETYLQRLQNMQLKNPVLVGFGIKDKQTFQSACRYANGAIIGTAYIKGAGSAMDMNEATQRNFWEAFCNSLGCGC